LLLPAGAEAASKVMSEAPRAALPPVGPPLLAV